MAGRSPPRIFSSKRRIAARLRSVELAKANDAARYVIDDMIEDAIERAGFLRFRYRRALLIGGWGLGLQDRLASIAEPESTCTIASNLFDEEQPFGPTKYDFILSLSSLATINDLPGALIHMRNALAPGGLMLASLPGAGSLPVLRQCLQAADGDRPAARLHPQIDVRAAAELLQRAGFANPVADSHSLQARFGSLDTLVGDLRAQGLANVLADPPPPFGKAGFARARDAFAALGTNGRTTEVFEIVTLTGWKR